MSIDSTAFLYYLNDIHERVSDGRLIIYNPINHIREEFIRRCEEHNKWTEEQNEKLEGQLLVDCTEEEAVKIIEMLKALLPLIRKWDENNEH